MQLEDHASQKLRIDGLFMLSKMDLNYTCSAPCKDKRKHRYTNNLVENVILQDVQDQPSLNERY